MTHPLTRLIGKLLRAEPRELPALAASFAFVFVLMAAYYVLRPVRDAMASDWSDAELSWLWTLNFFLSAGAVLLYGAVVSKSAPRRLVPGVYVFFAASFVLFYLGTRVLADTRLLDQAFYVWVSFFALFHVSVFWSFMAERFSREQSPRLFAPIGAGASIGAVFGPTVPLLFGERLGVYNLLLLAAVMLCLILPLIVYVERHSAAAAERGEPARDDYASAIGGRFADGFVDLLGHRFLLAIALFILLYTLMSTFVYFELKNVLAEFDRATRTRYWGGMDLAVNTLAILTALFATGRIASRLGLAVTLALIPALLVVGWLVVAIAPGVGVLVALQVVRRAGNYAVTKPGREMLFTAVGRETRFKTKPVIDIVVYRGGDVFASWTYTALAQGIGLGLGAIAAVAAVIAALWLAVGIFLGRRFDRKTALPEPATEGAVS